MYREELRLAKIKSIELGRLMKTQEVDGIKLIRAKGMDLILEMRQGIEDSFHRNPRNCQKLKSQHNI